MKTHYPNIPIGIRNHGFTLLEVLISITIMGILMAVAVPSMTTFYDGQRLIGAAEQVYGHLQQARTEAVARGTSVYVNFSASGSATWTYGMSSITSGCDLTKTAATDASACVMVVNDGDTTVHGINGGTDTGDLVLNRFASTDYSGVTMTLASFTTSSQIAFSSLRGTSGAGTITLANTAGTKQLRVQQSLLGRPKICSPNSSMPGYTTC